MKQIRFLVLCDLSIQILFFELVKYVLQLCFLVFLVLCDLTIQTLFLELVKYVFLLCFGNIQFFLYNLPQLYLVVHKNIISTLFYLLVFLDQYYFLLSLSTFILSITFLHDVLKYYLSWYTFIKCNTRICDTI